METSLLCIKPATRQKKQIYILCGTTCEVFLFLFCLCDTDLILRPLYTVFLIITFYEISTLFKLLIRRISRGMDFKFNNNKRSRNLYTIHFLLFYNNRYTGIFLGFASEL